MTIRPDGRLYVQSGVGNLGTHSMIDLARVAAEILQMPWDKVEVIWGDTSKHLPWSPLSVGSQTTHAMTRANHAGATDAKRKLQEIAAKDLGGSPNDYELSGKYDGHELPGDIHAWTKTSAAGLVGLGLMGVAKDNYPRDGDSCSFVAGFAEVEVDVETGQATLVDYLGIGDVGTVIESSKSEVPDSGRQLPWHRSRLDPADCLRSALRVALARRFHYSKPLSILDIPAEMHAEGLNIADPETPVGARGVESLRSAPGTDRC